MIRYIYTQKHFLQEISINVVTSTTHRKQFRCSVRVVNNSSVVVTLKSFHICVSHMRIKSAHVVFKSKYLHGLFVYASKNLNETHITSAVPSNNIAHDAV